MLAVGIGAPELLIILIVLLLLFGATRLPKLARSLGEAKKEFDQGLAHSNDERKSKSDSDI